MASGEVKMTLTIDGMRLVDDMGEIASDLSDLVDMTPDYNAHISGDSPLNVLVGPSEDKQ